MSGVWVTEELSWALVSPAFRPRDMEPRVAVYRGPSEDDARRAMFDRLNRKASEDGARLSGESTTLRAAATAILSGVDGVRIGNRYYRIYEER